MSQTITAVLDLLRSLDAPTGAAISLYQVGVPLVAEGYSETELASAVEQLIRDRVIEMVPGTNSVRFRPQSDQS